MTRIAGEYIDRFVSVEMWGPGFPRGISRQMHDVLQEKYGEPYCLLAAKRLVEAVKPGDFVFIMTGAGQPEWRPKGETDGPPGAASLARVIKYGLGGRPVLISAEELMEPIIACCRALGITLFEERELAEYDGFFPTGLLRYFPKGKEAGLQRAIELLDELSPKAIIATEQLGPNEKGVIHSAHGFRRADEEEAHVHYLVTEGRGRGILTIGIGDVGNEIGFGSILEEAKRIHADGWGYTCRCDCKGGIISTVETDVTVFGACTADVGAYGITAAIALLKGDLDLIHTPEEQRRMVWANAVAGAVGHRGWGQGDSGNLLPEAQVAQIIILRQIVENALQPEQARPF